VLRGTTPGFLRVGNRAGGVALSFKRAGFAVLDAKLFKQKKFMPMEK